MKNYFAGAYLIFTLILLPALALNEGLKYIEENKTRLKVQLAAQKLDKFISDLRIHANEENFWLSRLSEDFSSAKSLEEFYEHTIRLCLEYGVKADIIVYDGQGEYYQDNFLQDSGEKEGWVKAGKSFLQVIGTSNSDKRFAQINLLRPILGKNFYIPTYRSGDLCVPNSFYQTDFSTENYKYWFARSNKIIAAVRFRFAELEKTTGLRYFARNFHKDEKLAIFRDQKLSGSEIPVTEARFFFNQLSQNLDQDFVATTNSVFARCQISGNIWVLIKKQLEESRIKPGKFTVAIFLLLLCFFLILRQSNLIPKSFSDLSILGQILVLMAISIGIPLLVLTFVATGYFSNKRAALIHEENQRMISFFQQINENSKNEMSWYSRQIKRCVEENLELLRKDFSKNEQQIFNSRLRQIGPLTGYMVRQEKFHFLRRYRASNNQNEQKFEEKNVKVIADHHLSYLNNTPPKPVSIETSYIMEMFFQKSMPMLIHDFIQIEGNLSEMGWGNDIMMLFVESLALTNPQVFDAYMVLSFTATTFEQIYAQRHLHSILRNPRGYLVYLILNDQILLNTGEAVLDFPELREMVLKTSDYPLPEPVLMNFQDSPHIFVGLRGNKIKSVKFCILYPLEKIEKLIRQEATDLAYLAILAIAIVFSMVLTLYLNLILPVNRLRQAAHALEVRDANFRLPEDRSDEFGKMGRVFNTSIAEFEELQIAGIVQNRLLPTAPLDFAGFSVYGRSVPMAFLGGDYFDYFTIDDNRFAALLGDVAGHGVGASLIMAIAKAGVLSAADVNHDPALILGRLHQIILATKSKLQRKVMTFQYMRVDRQSNKVIYANAGGCSPVLIDKRSETIRVISHPGAVLGGFKKNVFKNLELELQPDQAIILYTDGMVEARNNTGNELGYNGLHEIFLQSFDNDATIYYQNIYRNFSTWLGDSDAGDDLTVMITVCNNRPAA